MGQMQQPCRHTSAYGRRTIAAPGLALALVLLLAPLACTQSAPGRTAFSLRLASLPGRNNSGTLEVKTEPNGTWGTLCGAAWVEMDHDSYNALPRLACHKMGLPWNKARRIAPRAAPRPSLPASGFLRYSALDSGQGIDSVQLLYQTPAEYWKDLYGTRPLPAGLNSSVCLDGYQAVAINCTDSPLPKPALRLVPHGGLTAPNSGVLQLKWREDDGWIHISASNKTCPDGPEGGELWRGQHLEIQMYEDLYVGDTLPQAVCKQLGLPSGGATHSWVTATGALANSSLSTGYVRCNGLEPDLGYCRVDEADTYPSPSYLPYKDQAQCNVQLVYFGVTCAAGPAPAPSPAPGPAPVASPQPNVRLVGGTSFGELQLKVKVNGTDQWAYVCSDVDFMAEQELIPHVACRELGKPWAGASKVADWADVTKGELYVRGVISCKGNESSVANCPATTTIVRDAGVNDDCFFSYGINCRDTPPTTSDILGYLLKGGNTTNEGVVAVRTTTVYIDGPPIQAYVCRDGFDDKAAQVVCRSMGRPYFGAKAVDARARFPSVRVNYFLLDDFKCSGQEWRLDACARPTMSPSFNDFPNHDCVELWDAAAVVCA